MPATSYALRKDVIPVPLPFSREPFGVGRFKIERRDEFVFAVLGPNPDAGKEGACWRGAYLTVCVTDGLAEAAMIAAALDAHPAARQWP